MDYQSWIYLGLLSWISHISGQSDEQYRCPNNDRRRTQTILPFQERCYQFVHEERYWTSARDYCRDHGGRLVTVNDDRTNRFLIDTLNGLPWSNSGVWIGLHDRDKELQWQWSTESGNVDEPVRFEYWARGHPKAFLHSLRDCVRMVRKSNWKWHETPCSALRWKYRFICEYGMLPPSTTPRQPTYLPGFHQPLEQANRGHGWARPPPPNTEGDDFRITADDVMAFSTTTGPHKSKTTTKPEHYEEDSIDMIVPMQLTQDRGKNDGRGNMIFGIVGGIVGVLCILAFVFVILIKRRKQKDDTNSRENPMYGATEDDDDDKAKGQDVKVAGRVMNIYTNPSDHLDHVTALQRLQLVSNNEEEVMMLMPSGDELCSSSGRDLEEDNLKNQKLEDASEYLEPQVCMAHRPLPQVDHKQGQPKGQEVEVKRKPQRFVRPKSPVPLSKESHAKVNDNKEDPLEDMVEHPYEDAEDVKENVYAEIPGDNIYETLDEMKKTLATMGEAEA